MENNLPDIAPEPVAEQAPTTQVAPTTPNATLKLDPETNQFVAVPVQAEKPADGAATAPPKPTRSWSRTKEDPTRFDSKFEFEGATVYMKSLTKAQRVILKVQEEANAKETRDIQQMLKEAQTDKEKEDLGDLMSETQMGYMIKVLKMTLRDWENVPDDIPFSPEAIEDLPFELMFEFVKLVMVKSTLGITEAELLKNNSSGSSKTKA